MLEITKQLLKTNDAPSVMQMLINSGKTSLEAAQLVCEALQPAKANGKINMKKLVIVCSEGLIGENIEFNSWNDFNSQLIELALEHDKDGYTGSYYKTKFQIHWEDGEVYEGRLDVNTMEDTNVGLHVKQHLQFHTGECCPDHMTQEEYDGYLKFVECDVNEAKSYLEKYNIVL